MWTGTSAECRSEALHKLSPRGGGSKTGIMLGEWTEANFFSLILDIKPNGTREEVLSDGILS